MRMWSDRSKIRKKLISTSKFCFTIYETRETHNKERERERYGILELGFGGTREKESA